MRATAWDLFCSAWFSVISHWLTVNSSFGHRSCSLSGWHCLVVLLCSARFIFLVGPSQASAFLWPAMWQALGYLGPNNALLTQTAIWRCGTVKPPQNSYEHPKTATCNSQDRRFGKPPPCQIWCGCFCNGLCNRRGLLSCDSKAFEHLTMECCVEQLFRLPTTRTLAWNICWLALLPEPIGITSCKPTPRTYPHDTQQDYFRADDSG